LVDRPANRGEKSILPRLKRIRRPTISDGFNQGLYAEKITLVAKENVSGKQKGGRGKRVGRVVQQKYTPPREKGLKGKPVHGGKERKKRRAH